MDFPWCGPLKSSCHPTQFASGQKACCEIRIHVQHWSFGAVVSYLSELQWEMSTAARAARRKTIFSQSALFEALNVCNHIRTVCVPTRCKLSVSMLSNGVREMLLLKHWHLLVWVCGGWVLRALNASHTALIALSQPKKSSDGGG